MNYNIRKIVQAWPVLVLAGLVLVIAMPALAAWDSPPNNAPTCSTDPADADYREGCNPPINTSASDQVKDGGLGVLNLAVDGRGVITSDINFDLNDLLRFGIDGNVGANKYCDLDGGNCKSISELGGSSWTVTPSGKHQMSAVTGSVAIGNNPTGPYGTTGAGLDASPNTRAKLIVNLNQSDYTTGSKYVGTFDNYLTGVGDNGIRINVRNSNAGTNILELGSPSASSGIVNRLTVKGDGNVCIGDPTNPANCRTSWPTGSNLPLNPECRNLTVAEQLASKMIWDTGGDSNPDNDKISCIADLTGGGPTQPAGVSSLSGGTGINVSSATGAVTVNLDINKLTQGGTPPADAQVAVYSPTLGTRKYPISSLDVSVDGSPVGDNLGNHTATQDLNMQSNNILLGSNSRISPIGPGNQSGLTIMTSGKFGLFIEDDFGAVGSVLTSNGSTANWQKPQITFFHSENLSFTSSADNRKVAALGRYNLCSVSRINSGPAFDDGFCNISTDPLGSTTSGSQIDASSTDGKFGWYMRISDTTNPAKCSAVCF